MEDLMIECIQVLRKKIREEEDPEQLHKITVLVMDLAQEALIRNRDLQEKTGYDPRYEYDPETGDAVEIGPGLWSDDNC